MTDDDDDFFLFSNVGMVLVAAEDKCEPQVPLVHTEVLLHANQYHY